MVLNVFFYHQSISYDAWMKSPIDLEKNFLRLKIRPKVTPGGTFPGTRQSEPFCLLT